MTPANEDVREMGSPDEDVLVIGCDESGSEGENLLASRDPVFVHGSVSLPLSAAAELRDWLRSATRTQAPELKSRTALAPANRSALLEALRQLAGFGNIALVDKSYFLTCKLIETLVGAHAAQYDNDIATSGHGRAWAEYLDRHAPSAVGAARWNAVLDTYNSLVRSHRRANATPPSVAPFFAALEDAFKHAADEETRYILSLVWDSRFFAYEYEGMSEVELRELDPLMPTMTAVARNWAMRIGDAPFEFLADTYSALTPGVRTNIVDSARMPLFIEGQPLPRPDLRGVGVADSRSDARIQLADILSGVGREVARLAMTGTFDDELQLATHEMLDNNVMASDGSGLDILVSSRPLRYRDTWIAAHWL